MKREIVGFEFHSYGEDLVRQILMKYLAGASLNELAKMDGVAFAQAQRIVDEAVARGVILPEEKHPQGCPATKLERAKQVWARHSTESPEYVAKIVGCGVRTVWRAKRGLS